MEMEVINDSLRNVAKAKEHIKSFIESENIANDILLETALELLEHTLQILADKTSSST